MHNLKGVVGAVALGAALSLAGQAMAATGGGTLGYSFTATGVGSCNNASTCNAAHPPVYAQQTFDNEFNANASSSAADAQYGLSHASTDVGTGFLSLPNLHSDVTGGQSTTTGFAWNYSEVQGAIAYTWTGGSFDMPVNTFVGTLNATNGAQFTGLVSVSLAILDSSVTNTSVGNLWYPADSQYGFAADCSTQGAIGVGETGYIGSHGAISATVAPTCGASTFHLNNGDEFVLWARMFTFIAGPGFVDASHTFSVGLNPNLTTQQAALLTSDLKVTQNLGVPEPATWAFLLLGFGGVGGLIRRRRSRGALAAG